MVPAAHNQPEAQASPTAQQVRQEMAKTNTAVKQNAEDQTTDAAPAVVPPADPFANLPVLQLAEASIQDLSGVETSNARKYGKVHAAAVEQHLPVMIGWKYTRAMILPGTNKAERKATSVMGMLQALAAKAGPKGIPAYELASAIRKGQIGNKRSHYCDKLPPVGWAEGYINGAMQRNILKVHLTGQAPAIVAEVAKGADGDTATDAKTA